MTPINLILRFALLATALSCFALTTAAQIFPSAEGKIEGKYDRFTDKTRVALFRFRCLKRTPILITRGSI
jgi:hypothetical protein